MLSLTVLPADDENPQYGTFKAPSTLLETPCSLVTLKVIYGPLPAAAGKVPLPKYWGWVVGFQ